jgi:class 3 adenylate cyclase
MLISMHSLFRLLRPQLKKFQSYADEIIEVSKRNALGTLGILRSLSDTMTSFAVHENAEWPFVSLPHFERRSFNYIATSGAERVLFAPLVEPSNISQWVTYSVNNQDWIKEGLEFASGRPESPELIRDIVWSQGPDSDPVPAVSDKLMAPLWQMYPTPKDTSVVNYNLRDNEKMERSIYLGGTTRKAIFSEVMVNEDLRVLDATQDLSSPKSTVLQPVMASFDPKATVAGFLMTVVPWNIFFDQALGEDSLPVVCVVDACGVVFSYSIEGPKATFLGYEDAHDSKFNGKRVVAPFSNVKETDDSLGDQVTSYCEYSLSIYPTKTFEEAFLDGTPGIYMAGVLLVFLLTSMVFVLYDFLNQKLNSKVVHTAERSNAIVNSLFPQEVQDRLFKAAEEQRLQPKAPKLLLQSFLKDEDKENGKNGTAADQPVPGQVFQTKPIADLFLNCTILFADISGFTAWSSVREPTQVFTLLESIYNSFDVIARKSKVFKVETIGDCYVAVCGLPTARKDHAVVMARYANTCLQGMTDLTRTLEVTLGPDTSDLAMRFGLHSGPVTAGVLRGEKSRFQLFGDTVNTAARIEGTGERNKIHCSEDTARLLVADGYRHWLRKRAQKVVAKGKGELQTYWVKPRDEDEAAQAKKDQAEKRNVDHKTERLVEWITGMMLPLLKKIIAHREAYQKSHGRWFKVHMNLNRKYQKGATVLDEVEEIIRLPKFDAEVARNQVPLEDVELSKVVVDQLRDLIEALASLYHDNPFHNFEHASHVTMSVGKLLYRIVAPDVDTDSNKKYDSQIHDHTYGITSDPLTQFAVAFSALIHDADHPGIPNAVLVKEKTPLAIRYNNKSVAEQNSVDLAWKLLMSDDYKDLRACLCPSEPELMHFRQLVVNSVMATDIVDKDLGAARKARWAKAFSTDVVTEKDVNRKATIVIEHLIQASDVAHTMQHWDVYLKWNERFFHECYLGYLDGRTDVDPLEGWYKGEIGFFDFYIIPLAKKLKECGVFGVSSDEYLNYALENRRQWSTQGEEIVERLRAKFAERVDSDNGDHSVDIGAFDVESSRKSQPRSRSRERERSRERGRGGERDRSKERDRGSERARSRERDRR